MSKYGFDEDKWMLAKEYAKTLLVDIARQKATIAYSILVAKISIISLDPHSYAMRAFLGEISTEEHEAGRGLLSVVVVYKHGEMMPGPGFFELAEKLGYNVRDQTEFWLSELRKVYDIWS
jgi:hypothetical protein